MYLNYYFYTVLLILYRSLRNFSSSFKPIVLYSSKKQCWIILSDRHKKENGKLRKHSVYYDL